MEVPRGGRAPPDPRRPPHRGAGERLKGPRVLRELLQNLGRRPATVLYPAEKLPVTEAFRGRIAILDEACIGCSKGAIVGPTECITMVPSERPVEAKGRTIVRKKKPVVRLFDCICCGLCEEYCPTDPKAIYLTTEFAGAGRNKEVLVT